MKLACRRFRSPLGVLDLVGALPTDAVGVVPCARVFGPGMTALSTVTQLS